MAVKNKKIPPKRTCHFYNNWNGGCNALTETLCVTKGKCGFYKTDKEYEDGLKKYPIKEI